ncbi:MAG: ice-binding family protein [Gemmatimonadales bacterium]
MPDRSIRSARTLASSRVTVGLFTALALFSGACKDTSSPIVSPSALAAIGKAPAAAGSNFTVLGNAAATCTDGTITGDVGTFLATPTGAITLTSCPVTGGIHVGDAAATQAFNAFLAAYAALAPGPADNCTMLTGTLDGVTLAPGTYCFDAAAALTGVLTLKGPSNGVWVFKIGTSGTGALTGTNFSVVMSGGAQPCNVTWWVAQAATMTTSAFQGSILAGAAITLTGGTFNGNAWAGASGVGDVTMTGTAVSGCAGSSVNGGGTGKQKCNQGVSNGPEGCDPGNSDHHNPTNDENGGTPGNPGRKGGN